MINKQEELGANQGVEDEYDRMGGDKVPAEL